MEYLEEEQIQFIKMDIIFHFFIVIFTGVTEKDVILWDIINLIPSHHLIL